MRIAGLPKSGTSTSRDAIKPRRNRQIAEAELQPLRREQDASLSLLLDEHTVRDLEIFTHQGSGSSLYEACNFTRTRGGGELLKQRMRTPWCDASSIRSTQQSLRFILSQRPAFNKLPSWITQGVEKYQRDVLLLVTQTNALEFLIASLSLRINHERHYRNILRGVQIAATVIRETRLFANQSALDSATGELALLLGELRILLNRPGMQAIPETEIESTWSWKILKYDQIFRFHEKRTLLRILQIIYEIDALLSMADASKAMNLSFPEVSEGTVKVSAEALWHPLLADAVANPVQLDQSRRVLFLTGPNMAGKTTYIRSFAIALYLAQLGMGVPARRFRFSPVQRLFSSISLNDDLHSGISYFRAEALRIKAVAEAVAAGYRIAAVMDEPFKGTNVKDAFDVSLEVLKRLAGKDNCIFLFSSHLIELEEKFNEQDAICLHHFEAQENNGRLMFDFLLRPGVSSQRLGVRVLREEGVFDILDLPGSQNLPC
jgi:DNA mismatch repair ATPase MutS